MTKASELRPGQFFEYNGRRCMFIAMEACDNGDTLYNYCYFDDRDLDYTFETEDFEATPLNVTGWDDEPSEPSKADAPSDEPLWVVVLPNEGTGHTIKDGEVCQVEYQEGCVYKLVGKTDFWNINRFRRARPDEIPQPNSPAIPDSSPLQHKSPPCPSCGAFNSIIAPADAEPQRECLKCGSGWSCMELNRLQGFRIGGSEVPPPASAREWSPELVAQVEAKRDGYRYAIDDGASEVAIDPPQYRPMKGRDLQPGQTFKVCTPVLEVIKVVADGCAMPRARQSGRHLSPSRQARC